jgi:hypothetical protein
MGTITKEAKYSLAYARDESVDVGAVVLVGFVEPSSCAGATDGNEELALATLTIPQISGSAVPGELTTVLRTPSCAIPTDTI